MRLVETEIARHDWKSMLCGCAGSAEHLARDLLRLAGRGSGQEPSHVSLEEHVWSPVVLWEPAPAVTSVALAVLADDVAPAARQWFLDLLQCVVAGEGTDGESARRGLDLPELCRGLALQGLRLLYEEVMSNRAPGTVSAAFEILTVVEPDRARLQRVREIAADWLPVCCRTGLCDDDLRVLDC
ncbi:hypothetical protein [Streptomyces carpinensis]|uniref:Uncharacterized protein n=1 Tax=Streptomyces carpinensis TaxID=66369 RepID=A0ABV1W3M2_9ACTN|nr:hypothetical protein [Streptomyces carpinensis]